MPESSSAVVAEGASPRPGGNRSRERTIRDLLEPKGEKCLSHIGQNASVLLGRLRHWWFGEGDGGTEDRGSFGDTVDSTTGVLSRCFSSIGPDCRCLAWLSRTILSPTFWSLSVTTAKRCFPSAELPGRKSDTVVGVLGLSGSCVEELRGLEVAIPLRQITDVVE